MQLLIDSTRTLKRNLAADVAKQTIFSFSINTKIRSLVTESALLLCKNRSLNIIKSQIAFWLSPMKLQVTILGSLINQKKQNQKQKCKSCLHEKMIIAYQFTKKWPQLMYARGLRLEATKTHTLNFSSPDEKFSTSLIIVEVEQVYSFPDDGTTDHSRGLAILSPNAQVK